MARSGCSTCRVRKVKCDETIPICRRCKVSGWRCEGPGPKYTFVFRSRSRKTQKVRKSYGLVTSLQLPVRMSRPATCDPVEARAFEYFLTRVAPCLAGGFDSNFWTLILPQISESDPAVRHAVLAISELYEHPPEHTWAVRGDQPATDAPEIKSIQALAWYNQSLSRFRSHMSNLKDTEKAQLALLSCILFTSLEFQQNNVQNAMKLLGRGYDVFALAAESMEPGSGLQNSLVEDILMPMFNRHIVLMACFGHHPPRQWMQRFHTMSQLEPSPMMSLREARMQLFHHTCRSLMLIHATGTLVGSKKEDTMEKLKHQQEVVVDRLRQWHIDFQSLLKDTGRLSPSFDETQKSAASMLLMYFYVAEIWALTCLDLTPMVYDDHRDRFEHIIRHAKESLPALIPRYTSNPPPFSFEMGVIPPLYFTAWKCHHPHLRRQALALIRKGPAQEALFSADLNYRAARKVIEIEEGPDHLPIDLVQYEACLQAGTRIVPPEEEDRVNEVAVYYENILGVKEPPSLIYTKGRSAESFAWEKETSIVPI